MMMTNSFALYSKHNNENKSSFSFNFRNQHIVGIPNLALSEIRQFLGSIERRTKF